MNHAPKRPYRPTAPITLRELAAYVAIGFFLGAAVTMAFVLWGLG